MKKTIVFAIVVILVIPVIAFAGDRVKGHWRDTNHDGIKDTYVQPYERTSPNSSRTDNYSYPGNYNPNTGQRTPDSNSPRETYPSNPNPYGHQRGW
jgi:hypothetical protein